MITKRPFFFWVLHRNRAFQSGILFLIMIGVFFRLAPLEMQKRIINTAIAFNHIDLLFLYCGFYMGSVILSGVLKYAANVLEQNLGQKILVEIRRDLYAHILSLPLTFFRQTQPGTVISAMTAELNTIGHFIGGALTIPLTSLLTLLTIIGYMLWLDFRLGVISLIVYPVELLVVPYLQRRYNQLNTRRVDATRAMSDAIGEAVSGIHEIHGNASYRLEQEKTMRFAEDLYLLMKRMAGLKYGIKFANNLFQNFGPFCLFLYGGFLAIHGKFTLGALVAFLSAYEKLYDPWKELIEYYQNLQDARVRYRRVMEIFDFSPEFALHSPRGESVCLNGPIAVEDLGYAVEGQMKILDAVSFRMAPGEQLAVVGFSGSGKSTLAMILGKIYRYETGRVQLNGHELKDLGKMEVGRHVGFISQHPFIFKGTIRENLVYACRALSLHDPKDDDARSDMRQRVLDMVRHVGLEDDIIRFGINTPITGNLQNLLPLDTLFRMRRVIHRKLEEEGHAHRVEFYDIRRFLNHVSLYRNLLFGEVRDGAYAP